MKTNSVGMAEATAKIFQLKGESTQSEVSEYIQPVIENRLITSYIHLTDDTAVTVNRPLVLLGFNIAGNGTIASTFAFLKLTNSTTGKDITLNTLGLSSTPSNGTHSTVILAVASAIPTLFVFI